MCPASPKPSTPDPASVSEVSDALLALDLVRGVSRRHLRGLLEVFGGPEEVFEADLNALRERTGCSVSTASTCQKALAEAWNRLPVEYKAMRQVGCRLLAEHMSAYPHLLRLIPDPPLVLRIQGRLSPEFLRGDQPSVAVVGTRRPTDYGRRHARSFASFFAEHGVHVVSGGARGIDALVHQSALEHCGGTTVVLGSGLGRYYPAEHARLFGAVLESGGAVLSEFPVQSPPRPANFPRRNRIVSGLSLGVLVIEAAARSGALITARLAVEDHGRECGALPGRIEDPSSAGCLKMISEGWGASIRSPEEAMELLVSGASLFNKARFVR